MQAIVALGENCPVWLVCTDENERPATPTGTPTYTVYEDGNSTAVVSATNMTGEVDSQTGFYRATVEVTSGNGFESGRTYVVVFKYVVSANPYTKIDTIQVA